MKFPSRTTLFIYLLLVHTDTNPEYWAQADIFPLAKALGGICLLFLKYFCFPFLQKHHVVQGWFEVTGKRTLFTRRRRRLPAYVPRLCIYILYRPGKPEKLKRHQCSQHRCGSKEEKTGSKKVCIERYALMKIINPRGRGKAVLKPIFKTTVKCY